MIWCFVAVESIYKAFSNTYCVNLIENLILYKWIVLHVVYVDWVVQRAAIKMNLRLNNVVHHLFNCLHTHSLSLCRSFFIWLKLNAKLAVNREENGRILIFTRNCFFIAVKLLCIHFQFWIKNNNNSYRVLLYFSDN